MSYATDQVPLKDGSLVTRTYLLKKQKKQKQQQKTNKKPHASGKFLQHIKNIHSILKGITTKKKNKKKTEGGEDMEQE